MYGFSPWAWQIGRLELPGQCGAIYARVIIARLHQGGNSMIPLIPLNSHNVFDYLGGGVLILCPFLFAFADLDMPRNVFMLCGLFLILYSLFTNYQYAMLRVIPLGVHMTLDVLLGVFLFMAPYILNYRGNLTSTQECLHYVLGAGVILLVSITSEKTEADKRLHGYHIKTGHPAA